MKNFFLLHLLLACTNIFSQSTPQWLFPIWFEDANGDRDTIYIGYDPSAGISNTFDEEFENYISFDTSKFNVLVNRDFTFSPSTGIWNSDSSKDIEITSSYYFAPYIDFIKGQMPITMFWDMSLLYSNDLPYPDLSPYPNAVAFIYCGAGEPGYVNCPSAFDDDPLSMVDSVNKYYVYPITSPHLFEGSGKVEPEEALSSFIIEFKPYELPTFIESVYTEPCIYPNPFSDYISLQSESLLSGINLYNSLGQLVKSESKLNSFTHILPTSDLLYGVYYLEIQAEFYKILKMVEKY